MCALCFLWMDVDMCDKGYVWKKLRLPSKASISQRFSVDLGAPDFLDIPMCSQSWWISISYFALRQGVTSYTHTKQGIWILFDQVGQPLFLSDLHHELRRIDLIKQMSNGCFTIPLLKVKFSFFGFCKKALAPSKFCIGSLPTQVLHSLIPVCYQILWSLRGFKCDEFFPILGKSSWFATKLRVETPQQVEKPARVKRIPLPFWVQMMSNKALFRETVTALAEYVCLNLCNHQTVFFSFT